MESLIPTHWDDYQLRRDCGVVLTFKKGIPVWRSVNPKDGGIRDAPPLPLGQTFYQGCDINPKNLAGDNCQGIIYKFAKKKWALLRNKTGRVLRANDLVYMTADGEAVTKKQVKALQIDAWPRRVDQQLSKAVPHNDLFWVEAFK